MRITGGQWKGRLVKFPQKGSLTRPLTGRMRESLFGMIQSQIRGATWADLFSGSGLVGLEALSRGASWVSFVEQDGRKKKVLHDNLAHISIEYFALYMMSVERFFACVERKFDIVFLDPPYAWPGKSEVLKKAEKILQDGGLIIFHHPRQEKLNLPYSLSLWKDRCFGGSQLSFLIRKDIQKDPQREEHQEF